MRKLSTSSGTVRPAILSFRTVLSWCRWWGSKQAPMHLRRDGHPDHMVRRRDVLPTTETTNGKTMGFYPPRNGEIPWKSREDANHMVIVGSIVLFPCEDTNDSDGQMARSLKRSTGSRRVPFNSKPLRTVHSTLLQTYGFQHTPRSLDWFKIMRKPVGFMGVSVFALAYNICKGAMRAMFFYISAPIESLRLVRKRSSWNNVYPLYTRRNPYPGHYNSYWSANGCLSPNL